MGVDMNDITARINHWLKKNDIPTDGVRVTIEFPDKNSTCRAEMSIQRELEPLQAYFVGGGSFGTIETMNGIGLSLRHR